jgi:hypothetical protein
MWGLGSSEMFRGVDWLLVSEGSGQYIGLIFWGLDSAIRQDSFTLEDGTDELSWNDELPNHAG